MLVADIELLGKTAILYLVYSIAKKDRAGKKNKTTKLTSLSIYNE